MAQQFRHFGLQIGLEARSYAYHLQRDDQPKGMSRDQEKAWTEWTPTIGTRFRFHAIILQSTTRVTPGTGFPGVDDPVFFRIWTRPRRPRMSSPRHGMPSRFATSQS